MPPHPVVNSSTNGTGGLRVLHAYTQHRGGGGAENAAKATIEVSQAGGLVTQVFTRSSDDLPHNLMGRLQAGLGAIWPRTSVAAFSRSLDSFRPQVVHIHDLFPLISPFILPLCARHGIPVVMTCVHYRLTCPVATHFREGRICTCCLGGREYRAILNNCRGNLAESATVALYNMLESGLRLSTRHIRHFIAPSDFTRQWLIDNARVEPSRISTISPVVRIPAETSDASAGSYIAYAGRLTEEKGVETLSRAAEITGLPFRVSRNASSLVRVDVPGQLEIVVTSNRSELDAFYRGARMLVFPSIWFETFGLAGAEAMSHGIPVIASRVGSAQSLVEDGVDGLLFEPGNSRDLADKIAALWNDPVRCRELGQAARRKAAALWSPERHLELLCSIYRRL